MKEKYLTLFKQQETGDMSDISWYEFNEKATVKFLGDEELDDLKPLFHGREDSYTVLAYEIIRSLKTSYYIGGVICNDDSNEIILFYFFDTGRKEKRDPLRDISVLSLPAFWWTEKFGWIICVRRRITVVPRKPSVMTWH